MIFNHLKNPVNQEPLRNMNYETRPVYTEYACTRQQFLLDLAAIPETVLSTQFFFQMYWTFTFFFINMPDVMETLKALLISQVTMNRTSIKAN